MKRETGTMQAKTFEGEYNVHKVNKNKSIAICVPPVFNMV